MLSLMPPLCCRIEPAPSWEEVSRQNREREAITQPEQQDAGAQQYAPAALDPSSSKQDAQVDPPQPTASPQQTHAAPMGGQNRSISASTGICSIAPPFGKLPENKHPISTVHSESSKQDSSTCELNLPRPEDAAQRVQTLLKLKRPDGMANAADSMAFGVDFDMLVVHLKASDLCCNETGVSHVTTNWTVNILPLQLKDLAQIYNSAAPYQHFCVTVRFQCFVQLLRNNTV